MQRSDALDPCCDTARLEKVLDIAYVACEQHVAGVREQRDRSVGYVTRLCDREKRSAASRRSRVERYLNRPAQRTGQARLASRIAPHLRDAGRRRDRVEAHAPSLEQRGAEPAVTPVYCDQGA